MVLRFGQALPKIVRASLPGVEFESSNCSNFLVAVEFEPPAHGSAEDAGPRTLYAKIPCPEVATRTFANAIGFWETEVVFCSQIASEVPIRVPKVFASVKRGARFVLLLENLNESPGTKLFINRDMAAGTTPERTRAAA